MAVPTLQRLVILERTGSNAPLRERYFEQKNANKPDKHLLATQENTGG
ncbi:hypothetical protein F7734_30520 [Scytonema sp. UIC 10036]|nr:hypothetical protein [Scytonema sp. UIC 10036]MUG96446.1 hypothetical protein [Scytonema sp. UIC 10036]